MSIDLRALSVLLLIVSLSGCASTARYMEERKPPQALAPSPDKAMVVFIRPSKLAWAVSANILDQRGTFLGDMPAKGHFAVLLPPGQHLLVIWAENTDALVATLLPGRIYFVEVYPTMGAFSAHMHMRAIKPGSAGWAHRDEWMLGTTQFFVNDAPGAQANLDSKGKERIAERIHRGQEHLASYSQAERFERSLAPEDGL